MIGPTSVALDSPFRIDGTGKVAVSWDLSHQIAQRLKSIIGTTPGERVMRPGYGAGAAVQVFDVNDDLRAASLASRIQDAIHDFEPTVLVDSVSVSSVDHIAGMLRIAVNYRLRSTGETTQATIAFSPTSTYGWPA
ncbi:MAG TPA: GPW/gp25 family protein [Gemmatimonadales bacterium]|nr:GPW/gp25 family protein [Gemmatimonadales bacterium]